MCDTVSFTELDEQHVELLPARTVLSMFSVKDPGGAIPNGVSPGQVSNAVLMFAGLPASDSGASGSSAVGNDGTIG